MNNMDKKRPSEDRRHRRSCFDRLRYRVHLARQRRRADPAFGALGQLLAIMGFVALTAPVSPSAIESSVRRRDRRADIADILGVPKRYVDVSLRLGRIPTSLLFADLRRPAAREDALRELRKRLPEPTGIWLDHIHREEAWSDLTRCFVQGSDEETGEKALKSTIRWIESQLDDFPPPGGATHGGGGDGGEGGEGGAPPTAPRPTPPEPDGDGPRFR
jgi:hypothetical protein